MCAASGVAANIAAVVAGPQTLFSTRRPKAIISVPGMSDISTRSSAKDAGTEFNAVKFEGLTMNGPSNDSHNETKWMILFFIVGCLIVHAVRADEGEFAYRLRAEYEINGEIHTSRGTATAISKHTLLTAAHTIQGAEEIFIDHKIGWLRCTVKKVDVDHDLAMLDCPFCDLHPIALEAAVSKVGDTVNIWGSPLGAKISKIVAKLYNIWDVGRRKGCWLCDATDFQAGCSGAPVEKDRRLVGIAVAMNTAEARKPLFVPAAQVTKFVNAPQIELTKAEIVPLPDSDIGQPPVKVLVALDYTPAAPAKRFVCTTGSCGHATVSGALPRSRHWDSDVDGHGQGGYVDD